MYVIKNIQVITCLSSRSFIVSSELQQFVQKYNSQNRDKWAKKLFWQKEVPEIVLHFKCTQNDNYYKFANLPCISIHPHPEKN